MELLDSNWVPNQQDTIERYLFWSPLGTSTFESLINSKADQTTRSIFLTQIMEGLEHLHTQGIMHRDIKPANLTVVRYEPPLCQIVDLGCATSKTTMLYDHPGTIPYLAPEQRDGDFHDCAVDCWAVALVGIQLFGAKPWRIQIDEDGLQRIKQWLGTRETHPALLCCTEMLIWDSKQRLTAAAALRGHLKEWAYKDYEQEGRKRKMGEVAVEKRFYSKHVNL
jgi:serine/threonine protein kinase